MDFSTSIKLLEEGIYWVIFRFSDMSCILVRTTTNKELLGDFDRDDSIFDFERQKLIPLSIFEESKIEIYRERPRLSEVDIIANRFV